MNKKRASNPDGFEAFVRFITASTEGKRLQTDKSEFIGKFSTVFDGLMRRLITAPTEGRMICVR